jgi:hypothetical protein
MFSHLSFKPTTTANKISFDLQLGSFRTKFLQIPPFSLLFHYFGDASHVGANTTGQTPFAQNL